MNRLLVLNLYYSPESFGGATIVAEETCRRLQDDYGWSVLVVTSMRDHSLPPYVLKRYRTQGVNVVAINLPYHPQNDDLYRNPEVSRRVVEIAEAFGPDICHCHSVQLMGCGFFEEFAAKGIRLAVTVHDCWWICERQFMINSDGLYCNQWRIDEAQCRYCSYDYARMQQRNAYLRERMDYVDLLLFPSEFHRQLHLANGFVEDRCVLNKNGVTRPAATYPALRKRLKQQRERVTFGFVGGPGFIKGADQIIAALNRMERSDYTLRVVDAAAKIGASWGDQQYWKIPGELQIVKPYSQATMDEFFASIDILLFPSQWKESFGLTVREALVRDVWVIAADAGGVAEDLSPGVNATVLPFGFGVEELQLAIESCLDPERLRSYENPEAARVRGFDEQAREISHFFKSLL